MKLKKGLVAFIGIFILIIDTKTTISGAKDGINLCLHTVIPALLPFIVLTYIINGEFIGIESKLLSPIGKICSIPQGCESIFILGLLGGYPVGAQCIEQAYCHGHLDENNAKRMLGFCSNAGPAFIFGIGYSLFPSFSILVSLWIVHILSAVLVGYVLPSNRYAHNKHIARSPVTFSSAIEHGVKTIGLICCWIVMFRILIAFLDRWFLWLLPIQWQAAVIGICELANGCDYLSRVINEPVRYVLFSGLLGLGGICVYMQTNSVCKKLGTGLYFPGKLMQSCFSIMLSTAILPILFPMQSKSISYICFAILLVIISWVGFFKRKKVVAFQK